MTTTVKMKFKDVACAMYTAYFYADPNKAVQVAGWIDAAKAAVKELFGVSPQELPDRLQPEPVSRSFREDLILVFAEKLRTPQDIIPERLRGCVLCANEIIDAMDDKPKT
jgi:hypothetical protein